MTQPQGEVSSPAAAPVLADEDTLCELVAREGEADLGPAESWAGALAEQASISPVEPAVLVDALPLLDAEGEVRPLEEVEAELIRYAITHYRGQMSEVARRLRIGRSTLYRKLDALGLNSERTEQDSEAVAAERHGRKIA